MSNESKTASSLQKDINRIRKRLVEMDRSNTLRREQVKFYDKFIHNLLNEKRITVEELKKYFPKRKETLKKLNDGKE